MSRCAQKVLRMRQQFYLLVKPCKVKRITTRTQFFLIPILPLYILCQIHSTASRALINSCHYLVDVIGGAVITTVRIRCPGFNSNIPVSGTSPSVLQDHSRMGGIGGCAMLSGCYMFMSFHACFVFNYECIFDAYPKNVRSCPF